MIKQNTTIGKPNKITTTGQSNAEELTESETRPIRDHRVQALIMVSWNNANHGYDAGRWNRTSAGLSSAPLVAASPARAAVAVAADEDEEAALPLAATEVPAAVVDDEDDAD